MSSRQSMKFFGRAKTLSCCRCSQAESLATAALYHTLSMSVYIFEIIVWLSDCHMYAIIFIAGPDQESCDLTFS